MEQAPPGHLQPPQQQPQPQQQPPPPPQQQQQQVQLLLLGRHAIQSMDILKCFYFFMYTINYKEINFKLKKFLLSYFV